jgi:hypothetical protein
VHCGAVSADEVEALAGATPSILDDLALRRM